MWVFLVTEPVQDQFDNISVAQKIVRCLPGPEADPRDALRDKPYQLCRMGFHIVPLPALIV